MGLCGQRYHSPRFHAEDRTEALSSGEDTVPHGLMNRGGILGSGRQKFLESDVGGLTSLLQYFFQHGIAV
jgi:hypothetical protein